MGEVEGGGGWKASVWSEAMNHEVPRAAEVGIGNGRTKLRTVPTFPTASHLETPIDDDIGDDGVAGL